MVITLTFPFLLTYLVTDQRILIHPDIWVLEAIPVDLIDLFSTVLLVTVVEINM